MPRIGLSAVFRHLPGNGPCDDGPTTIAASTPSRSGEDLEAWKKVACPEVPPIMPRIGFMACWDGVHMVYSFTKWEPPQLWPRETGHHSRGANIATCRVGDIKCSCGTKVFPIKPDDNGKVRCPWCGATGVQAEPIKVPSDRFYEMLGDLRDPLEEAARRAYEEEPEPFRFPMALISGIGIEPSAAVPPNIQGAAQSIGMGCKPLADVDMAELWRRSSGNTALQIVPGITSGTMDSEEAKAGKSWQEGVVKYWVKLRIHDAPHVGFSFGGCKF